MCQFIINVIFFTTLRARCYFFFFQHYIAYDFEIIIKQFVVTIIIKVKCIFLHMHNINVTFLKHLLFSVDKNVFCFNFKFILTILMRSLPFGQSWNFRWISGSLDLHITLRIIRCKLAAMEVEDVLHVGKCLLTLICRSKCW